VDEEIDAQAWSLEERQRREGGGKGGRSDMRDAQRQHMMRAEVSVWDWD